MTIPENPITGRETRAQAMPMTDRVAQALRDAEKGLRHLSEIARAFLNYFNPVTDLSSDKEAQWWSLFDECRRADDALTTIREVIAEIEGEKQEGSNGRTDCVASDGRAAGNSRDTLHSDPVTPPPSIVRGATAEHAEARRQAAMRSGASDEAYLFPNQERPEPYPTSVSDFVEVATEALRRVLDCCETPRFNSPNWKLHGEAIEDYLGPIRTAATEGIAALAVPPSPSPPPASGNRPDPSPGLRLETAEGGAKPFAWARDPSFTWHYSLGSEEPAGIGAQGWFPLYAAPSPSPSTRIQTETVTDPNGVEITGFRKGEAT